MKKYLALALSIISVLLISGCGKNNEEKTITCTLTTSDSTQGYSLNATYTIYSNGKTVSKVSSVEKIESTSNSFLEQMKKGVDKTYSTYNANYGGYTYSVDINGNTLTSTADIDYSQTDLKKYAEDNDALKSYLTSDGKMLTSGIKEMYESLGAVCE